MRIAVMGAGVIGVTTAYYLAQDGHDVTVIDRQSGPGLETSFANGGQVSANQPFVWGSPGVVRQALSMMFKADSPLLIKPFRWDPDFWRWSAQLLKESSRSRHDLNLTHVLSLAVYSRNALGALRQRTNIQYDGAQNGILKLYHRVSELEEAKREADVLTAGGVQQQVLDRAGCLAAEPALRNGHTSTIVGGLLAPAEEHGDAHQFTFELAERAKAEGVEFLYDQAIERLVLDGPRVTGLHCNGTTLPADAFVLCLGSFGRGLLSQAGVNLPTYPIKGYSISAPVTDPAASPSLSVTDEEKRVVISPLGDVLRAAGTAEFSGYSTDLNPVRLAAIRRAVETLFPKAADYETAAPWTGLRPVTPDSRPVIGLGGLENLVFNTGHGALGWTMAAGSAQIVADLIAGRAPEIDAAPFSPDRFA